MVERKVLRSKEKATQGVVRDVPLNPYAPRHPILRDWFGRGVLRLQQPFAETQPARSHPVADDDANLALTLSARTSTQSKLTPARLRLSPTFPQPELILPDPTVRTHDGLTASPSPKANLEVKPLSVIISTNSE